MLIYLYIYFFFYIYFFDYINLEYAKHLVIPECDVKDTFIY